MFVEKWSGDLTIQAWSHREWIKSPCKTMPLFSATKNTICTGASGDVRWHKRHARGPQLGQCVAWLAPTPCLPWQTSPEGQHEPGGLRRPFSDVTLMYDCMNVIHCLWGLPQRHWKLWTSRAINVDFTWIFKMRHGYLVRWGVFS